MSVSRNQALITEDNADILIKDLLPLCPNVQEEAGIHFWIRGKWTKLANMSSPAEEGSVAVCVNAGTLVTSTGNFNTWWFWSL